MIIRIKEEIREERERNKNLPHERPMSSNVRLALNRLSLKMIQQGLKIVDVFFFFNLGGDVVFNLCRYHYDACRNMAFYIS